jgi:hypothetical protein
MSRFSSPAFRAVKAAKRIFSICVRRTGGTGTGVSTDVDAALLVLARLVGGVWCLLAIEDMLEEGGGNRFIVARWECLVFVRVGASKDLLWRHWRRIRVVLLGTGSRWIGLRGLQRCELKRLTREACRKSARARGIDNFWEAEIVADLHRSVSDQKD